jgi:hypothetical protein
MAAIPRHFEYAIQPGDTLTGIIQKLYLVAPSSPDHRKSLDYLLALNPQIKDPNRIRTGDVIRITEELVAEAQQANNPPASVVQTPLISANLSGPDRAGFHAVTWMAENSNYFLIPGSIAIGTAGNLLSGGNLAYINQMNNLYADYKLGNISKGQYDYRRASALRNFQANIGPMDRVLFGQGGSQQKLRIARAGGVPANAHLASHAARLKRLGNAATVGGIVLTGVGVAASCVQIAHTADQKEKSLILVESAASSVVSVVGGIAVGLFVLSNPIGWTALALAAGTALASYSAGKSARFVYDRLGTAHNLASVTRVDQICK